MIRATATKDAPWYVVPADNKWFTRVVVAAAIIDALGSLDLKFPQVDDDKKKELAAARHRPGAGMTPACLSGAREEASNDQPSRPRQQREAERRAETAAPGEVLLDRHDRAEQQHPADAAHADHEHQQHQRPAAADAEHAVMRAEPERLAPLGAGRASAGP